MSRQSFFCHPNVVEIFGCPLQPPAQLKTNTTAVINKAKESVWQDAAGLQKNVSENSAGCGFLLI